MKKTSLQLFRLQAAISISYMAYLKTAMNQSAWSVDKLLKGYWIFHDSSAGRYIYASEGGVSVFRFVKWVWYENFPITNFCELFQGCWHVKKSGGGKTVFLKSNNMVFLL